MPFYIKSSNAIVKVCSHIWHNNETVSNFHPCQSIFNDEDEINTDKAIFLIIFIEAREQVW
jgi:hypothetical protein